MRKQPTVKEPKYLMLAALIVVVSAGIVSIGLGTRKPPTTRFLENHSNAKQIVNLPNGTFKMKGTMLWHDRDWGRFQFEGLDGYVELPYDGKAVTFPFTGALTIQSGSGSIRVVEVKR